MSNKIDTIAQKEATVYVLIADMGGSKKYLNILEDTSKTYFHEHHTIKDTASVCSYFSLFDMIINRQISTWLDKETPNKIRENLRGYYHINCEVEEVKISATYSSNVIEVKKSV